MDPIAISKSALGILGDLKDQLEACKVRSRKWPVLKGSLIATGAGAAQVAQEIPADYGHETNRPPQPPYRPPSHLLPCFSLPHILMTAPVPVPYNTIYDSTPPD
jgi:hypothetical protein